MPSRRHSRSHLYMDAVYYRSVSMGAEAAANAVFSSRTRNIIDGQLTHLQMLQAIQACV
jgi:hypothetical protein